MNTEQLDMLVAFVALTSSEKTLFNEDTGNLPRGIKDLEDGPIKSAWKSAVKCYSDTPIKDLVKAVGDLVWSMPDTGVVVPTGVVTPDFSKGDWLFEFAKEMRCEVSMNSPIGRRMRKRMIGAVRQHHNCFEPHYLNSKQGLEATNAFESYESSEEAIRLWKKLIRS
jgi:hypothetical protein